MGSLNSTLTSDQVMAGTAVAAVVAVSAALYTSQPPVPNTSGEVEGQKDAAAKKSRRKKGKARDADGSTTPPLLAAPAALFGDEKDQVSSAAEDTAAKLSNSLQVPLASSMNKSSKKKRKVKSSTNTPAKSSDDEEKTPEPQARLHQQDSGGGVASSSSSLKAGGGSGKKTATNKLMAASTVSMDASWTRVDSGRSGGSEAEASSDAGGATTSVTGDEGSSIPSGAGEEEPKTLAEKLVAKPPRTEVDDMLPADPGLARVMRIGGQPVPEKPAGISWRDYEDADELQHSTDADAEDEGWGIVQGKKPRPPIPAATEASSSTGSSVRIPGLPSIISDADLAKRQRQRDAKREAVKAAKADGEAERLAILAKYKREQEKARMDAQGKKAGKSSKLSGGMTASVQDGNLVWE
ncbi:hypothetical protein FRB98_004565 [Tulasnella sp. 332]|nr:hypothetical protein FRB98_004565 [Tulasnella sp. 332]